MLTPTTNSGNPKQIVSSTNASGIVMYTVPAGKKFQGYIYATGQNQEVYITPSGGSAASVRLTSPGVTSASATPPLLTLVPGTIVTSVSTNYTTIIGVETDA